MQIRFFSEVKRGERGEKDGKEEEGGGRGLVYGMRICKRNYKRHSRAL